MKNILLSHSGKQHSYKLALSLENLGLLARFLTSTYYDPLRFPDNFFSRFKKLDQILRKRHEPGLSNKVKRFPIFEVPELVLRVLLKNSKLTSDAVCLRDTLFDKFVARTQIHDCRIFWGFQGSCLESLKVAKRKSAVSIVELATGHVNTAIKILQEEKQRNPEWADSISNLYFPDWYLRRIEKEPIVADYCIVASEFTNKTLIEAGIESSKILKLPLGVDLQKFKFKKRAIKYPFQILFVGGVGQRKGIKYLLDAVRLMNSDKIKLKIIGPIVGSGKAFKKYSEFYEYLGVLSQENIVKHMYDSDCLVLPSLFEGFGLVIPEAMATGMPVIAGPNSAAPDIVREGVDGFIIRPDDVSGLAEKIIWMTENREIVIRMGKNAADRAKEFSWDKHQERVSILLKKIENER